MIIATMKRFRNKKIIIAVYAFILLISVVLRFYKLGSVPESLYIDEVAMLADVKAVLATGNDMHGNPWYQLIYPSYGDFKSPVYIWLATISGFLFSPSQFSLRLPSALAGVGTIVLAGLISKKLANLLFTGKDKRYHRNIWPLASMFVMAVSPWSVLFSRTGFEGHVAQFFVWLSMYLILISRRRWLLFFLGLFFGIVAVYTYYSVRFVWPMLFFFMLMIRDCSTLSKLSKPLIIKSVAQMLMGIALVFVALLPLRHSQYFETSEQLRLSTRSLIDFNNHKKVVIQANALIEEGGGIIFDRVIFHRNIIWFKELALNYSDNLSFDFLFLSGDSNLRHGTGNHGVFLLGFLPFFLFGSLRLLRDKPALTVALFFIILATLLPASIPETTPHALRSLNALVPFSIVIGFGLSYFLTYLLHRSGLTKNKRAFLLETTILLIFFSIFEFTYYYFQIYPKTSRQAWFLCEKKIIEQVNLINSDGRNIYLENAPERLYLWYLAYYEADVNKLLESASSRDNFEFIVLGEVYFNAKILEKTVIRNTTDIYTVSQSECSLSKSMVKN